MQTIFELQNEEKHIDQLAAQRQLYSDAKKIQYFLFIIAVPITIIIFILGNVISSMQLFASFWGGIIAIIQYFIFNNMSQNRIKAAKIQELFDCEVLQIPWNKICCNAKPDFLEISQLARKLLRSLENKQNLINWYFEKPDCLPLPYSRLICQRSNLSWDNQLRKKYSSIVSRILLYISIILLVITLVLNITLRDFMLFWMLPILPAYIWALEQWHAQRNATNEQDVLNEDLEEIWTSALSGDLSAESLERNARNIQNKIYSIRKNILPIPDILYRHLRSEFQEYMYKNADQLCQESMEIAKQNNFKIK